MPGCAITGDSIMPWIRFTADVPWPAAHNATIAYKAGRRYLVSQQCAEQALRDGKAVKAPARRKVSNRAGG